MGVLLAREDKWSGRTVALVLLRHARSRHRQRDYFCDLYVFAKAHKAEWGKSTSYHGMVVAMIWSILVD